MTAELVEYLARQLVDEPDAVRVEQVEREDALVIQLYVAEDDLGKVIGRAGRTAKSLRTVVAAVGGKGIRVDVVDTDRR